MSAKTEIKKQTKSETFVRGKFPCFTMYGIDEKTHLPKPIWDATHKGEKIFNYMIYQLERCPDTKRLHWQGYAECIKNRDVTTIMKAIGFGQATTVADSKGEFKVWGNITKRWSTAQKASNYCAKVDTAVDPDGAYEFGEMQEPEIGPGTRTDLDSSVKMVVKMAKEGKTLDEVKLACGGMWWKYGRNIESFFYAAQEDPIPDPKIELRPWQHDILAIIAKGFVKRQIIWVWSEESGRGKTTFLDYLDFKFGDKKVLQPEWDYKELMYNFNKHSIIALNLPRHTYLKYDMISLLEKISDGGRRQSTKYGTCMKLMQAIIIVFANVPPPISEEGVELLPMRCTPINIDTPEFIASRLAKQKDEKKYHNPNLD